MATFRVYKDDVVEEMLALDPACCMRAAQENVANTTTLDKIGNIVSSANGQRNALQPLQATVRTEAPVFTPRKPKANAATGNQEAHGHLGGAAPAAFMENGEGSTLSPIAMQRDRSASPVSSIGMLPSPALTEPLDCKRRMKYVERMPFDSSVSESSILEASSLDVFSAVPNTPSDIFCTAPCHDDVKPRTPWSPITIPNTPSTIGERTSLAEMGDTVSKRTLQFDDAVCGKHDDVKSRTPWSPTTTIPNTPSTIGERTSLTSLAQLGDTVSKHALESSYTAATPSQAFVPMASMPVSWASHMPAWWMTFGPMNATATDSVQRAPASRETPGVRRLNLQQALADSPHLSVQPAASPNTSAVARCSGSVLQLSKHLPTPQTAQLSLSRCLGIETQHEDLKPRKLFGQ